MTHSWYNSLFSVRSEVVTRPILDEVAALPSALTLVRFVSTVLFTGRAVRRPRPADRRHVPSQSSTPLNASLFLE